MDALVFARILIVLVLLLMAAVAGGFLGRVHPLGDSLAIWRTALSLATLGVAGVLAASGARRWGISAASVALLSLATVGAYWLPARGDETDLTIYQKNRLMGLRDVAPLVDDILASGADIVTLQETMGERDPLIEALRGTYPERHFCSHARVGLTAILSKAPMRRETAVCAYGSGLAGIVVEPEGGPVWVGSVHFQWPFPANQQRQAGRIAEIVSEWEGPVVIGGDFNMVPWSWSVREVARAARAGQVGPPRVSLVGQATIFRLPIDHVLATGGRGTRHMRPTFGSDHRGLLVGIDLPDR